MRYEVNKESNFQEDQIRNLISSFSGKGASLHKGRNEIKIFKVGEADLNIKSFRIPNLINKFAYRFFRLSKAERSFKYAKTLIQKGINTPFPVAYAVHQTSFNFLDSYYISRHLHADLTYRELVHNPDLADHEEILRAFTRFTFELHEKEIEFLDHSPGNTLIKRVDGEYKFYLVDLNRMNFTKMDFDRRMKNFSRLTPKKSMIRVMANEYAKLIEKNEEEVFKKMWFYTDEFQKKFHRKKELKKRFKRLVGK
ncbi:Kdo domain containing protein [Gramella sp. BOM4]|nr:Kdo domain containing protein [Christiangramia bathymodioli]